MERISIGGVTAATFNFTLRNYLRLLGIVWLPLLLTSLVSVYVLLPASTHVVTALVASRRAQTAADFAPILGGEAFAFVMLVMLAVGITRFALNPEHPAPVIFLTFGADFWRTLAAFLLLLLTVFALLTIGIIAFGALVAPIAIRPSPAVSGASAILPLIAVGLVFYGVMFLVLVRLGLLLPSVIVAEQRIGLVRAWRLARGNYWRLLVTSLAVLIAFVAAYGLQVAIVRLTNGLFPGDVMPGFDHQLLILARTAAGTLAFGPLLYGLVFGLGAFAYRALVPTSGVHVADVF